MDPRTQQMADVLVNYSLEVCPGDWVSINSGIAGEPLVAACVAAVLQAGGHPTVQFASDLVQESVFRDSPDDHLTWVSPLASLTIEKADVLLHILAPTNTKALSAVNPNKMAMRNKAHEPLMEKQMQRETQGLRWNVCAFPTLAGAQDAGMSLGDYEDFVYGAGLLTEPDPVEAWKRLGERQQHLVEWLQDKSTLRITGPDTDLTVGIKGRTWLNDDGHKNFPGGEVFTGPIEDSVEGNVAFNWPGFYNGREVSGVRLTFRGGTVVDAHASGDETFLQEMLGMDDGAKRLGEFAIGTNYGIQRMTKSVLFDEKIGGSLHMALGASIPGTGGVNKSALHWDMVYNLRDGGEIFADGELLSRNGEFVIDLPR